MNMEEKTKEELLEELRVLKEEKDDASSNWLRYYTECNNLKRQKKALLSAVKVLMELIDED